MLILKKLPRSFYYNPTLKSGWNLGSGPPRVRKGSLFPASNVVYFSLGHVTPNTKRLSTWHTIVSTQKDFISINGHDSILVSDFYVVPTLSPARVGAGQLPVPTTLPAVLFKLNSLLTDHSCETTPVHLKSFEYGRFVL
ncbi:hypothetical protein L1987_75855 [Smallanthus sonchifolius]|uniref:Uncharacterized protein n=1 Tax=Smallanthus sonchifolius TaxID=185202 RepID=A0ACB9A788_9ASTR|nr:hypothetical protein L1987_75855 [Smallanthus sonchifolius]